MRADRGAIDGPARADPVSPDALTVAGVTLCAAGAVVVYFEYRGRVPLLLARRRAVRRRLGPRHPRRRARAHQRQGDALRRLPRLDDRPDRRGRSCSGRSRSSSPRDGNEVALAFAFAAVVGSFLVSYARPRRGAGAEGRRRDREPGGASGRHRLRARPRTVGRAPWAIYLLTVTAWMTVVQRVLSVRAQLRAR